jgi:hypothetical protein
MTVSGRIADGAQTCGADIVVQVGGDAGVDPLDPRAISQH